MFSKETVIGLASSLVRIGEFIGLDETARRAIEKFEVEADDLDDDLVDVLGDLESLKKTWGFDKRAEDARYVCFDVLVLMNGKQDDLVFRGVGPVGKYRMFSQKAHEGDGDDVLINEKRYYVVFEIDHELMFDLQSISGELPGLEGVFSLHCNKKMDIERKFFI